MANNNGFIAIYRKITEHWLWDNYEPFDRAHAWIDLIFMANFRDKDVLFNGKMVTVRRGQRITSLRNLSEKWNWSKDKTARFLDTLEADGMITRESDRFKTLITIVNYEFYQNVRDTEKTLKSHSKDTDKPTKKPLTRTLNGTREQGKQRNKGNHKEKEIYKEKEVAPPALDGAASLPEDNPDVLKPGDPNYTDIDWGDDDE